MAESSESYKILINLVNTVKNEDDKVHLKKEIKNQLLPAFSSREEDRVSEALQCYKAVCQILKNNNFQWDILDDIDDLLLSIMENEQMLVLRKCYEEILLVVVDNSGLSSLKWSARLISLFKDYCRVDTGSGSGLNSLKALKIFILNTWPRLKENWGRLISIVLETLYDLHYAKVSRPPEETEMAKNLCIESIALLHKAVPTEIDRFIGEILKTDIFDSNFKGILKNIILTPVENIT